MPLNNAGIEHEIAALTNEVQVMKGSESLLAGQLKNLRSSLQNREYRIAQLHNFSSPIGSLPNEILAEVFKTGSSTAWDSLDFAMSVSQVIQRWRGVALSIPSLWAFIHIGFLSRGKWLRLMKVFLKRSLENPLDIIIHFNQETPQNIRIAYPADPLDYLEELLLMVVHRWRRISVVGTVAEDVFQIIRHFRWLSVPLLETLELKALDDELFPYWAQPLYIFEGGAPQLKHIKIEGLSLSFCHPPPSSLLSLHLDPQQLSVLGEIQATLAGANNLTDLHILGNIGIPSSGLHELKIPSLRSLSILTDPAQPFDDLFYFLGSLEAPSLEHLTVHCTFLARREPDFDRISGDYQHPQLLSLTLCCSGTIHPWEATCLVMTFPSITHLALEVDIDGSFKDLIYELLPRDHDPDEQEWQQQSDSLAWPQLSVFALFFWSWRDLDAICDVVSSRILYGAPIGCVQLPELSSIPVETLKWLQERVTVEEI